MINSLTTASARAFLSAHASTAKGKTVFKLDGVKRTLPHWKLPKRV